VQIDPRKGKVVELRYFGGLSVEETAVVLKVSKETVTRDWRMAKSGLLLNINGPPERPGNFAALLNAITFQAAGGIRNRMRLCIVKQPP